MDEIAEEGARRELKEETGLEGSYMEQFHTFSAPERDPHERVITIAYYALVKIQEVKGGDDAASAITILLNMATTVQAQKNEVLKYIYKNTEINQTCSVKFTLQVCFFI